MAILAIDRNPSPRTLALFGPLLGLVFSVLAGLLTLKGGWGPVPAALLGLGVAVAVVTTLVPPLRRPVYLGWVTLAWPIGLVVSIVLLAAIWLLVVTPIGLLRRTFGGDPMQRGFDPEAETYWQHHPGPPEPERYTRPW